MTNRQWLIWQIIDMSDEELIENFGSVCDLCSKYITLNRPCPKDYDSMLLDWLKQEHKEGYKLKPCFCGAIDEVELLSLHHTPIAENLYYVECGICKSRTNLYDEEKGAVEAWNRRVKNGR